MSRRTKGWVLAAIALVGAGCTIFAVAMNQLKGDFSKLATVKYETNTYELNEPFQSISIVTGTADVEFLPAEDGNCKVVCYEMQQVKHNVTVKDGTLAVQAVDTRKWYDHIGINFSIPKITVYIPSEMVSVLSVRDETGSVHISDKLTFQSVEVSNNTGRVNCYASARDFIKLRTTTGSINVKNTTAQRLELAVTTGAITVAGVECAEELRIHVSTGKARITDTNCASLTSEGSTGDLVMENLLAAGKITASRSTGDIKLVGCDAAELHLETDTGDIEGSLRSAKVFIAKTDTGDVRVPDSAAGGRCEVITDTGDINIWLV